MSACEKPEKSEPFWLPLIYPHCGGQMYIIAFITFSADMHKISEYLKVDIDPPRITPALRPRLWDDCGAQESRECMDIEPDWDMTNQSEPDYTDDQPANW